MDEYAGAFIPYILFSALFYVSPGNKGHFAWDSQGRSEVGAIGHSNTSHRLTDGSQSGAHNIQHLQDPSSVSPTFKPGAHFSSLTRDIITSYRMASSSRVEAWSQEVTNMHPSPSLGASVEPCRFQFTSIFPFQPPAPCMPRPSTRYRNINLDFLVSCHNDIRAMYLLSMAAQQTTSKQ